MKPDDTTRELRRTMLRLRLEMHRQEIRHEAMTLLQPLHQAQSLGRHWRDELKNSNAPLWITGGAFALTFLGLRSGQWKRWLRIAMLAFPMLRKRQPRSAKADEAENATPAP